MLPRHRPVGIKKLALDGAPAPVPFLRHQVDACVLSIAARPFIPHPDLGKPLPPNDRFLQQGRFHQPLKGTAHAKHIGGTVAQEG